MVLSNENIIKYVKCPKNQDIIHMAVCEKQKAELHITGKGLDKFLERVDEVENKDYISLKKKLTNAITTAIYEDVIKPVSRVFSAKGGSISFDVSTDKKLSELKSILKSDISKGKNLDEYLEKIWGNFGIWIDPLGMSFFEYNDANELSLKYIPVSENGFINYHDISYTSFDEIDYVIFNEGETEIDETKYNLFRVVDDLRDVNVIQEKENTDNVRILNETESKNEFGFVPACLNSNLINKQNLRTFQSYCKESFFIADNYLNDFADFRIYKKKLGIPRFWEFKQACETCGGTGQINTTYNGEFKQTACGACHGTGENLERNLSDVFRVSILDDGATKDIIPPTGAVTIPVDIQQQMLKELNEAQIKIYENVWGQGSYVDREKKNTTAYEISIRNEEKLSKLQTIDRNRAKVLEKLIKCVGVFKLGDAFKGVTVRPSNQFILNTSTETLEIYKQAKKDGLASYQLDKLYKDYLYAEYQHNLSEYDKQVKLLLVNPLPHDELNKDTKELLTIVEQTIKKNFERYIYTFEIENGSINSIDNTVEKIYSSLQTYAQKDINYASIN